MEILQHTLERMDCRLIVGLPRQMIMYGKFNGCAEPGSDITDEPPVLSAAQKDEWLVQFLWEQEVASSSLAAPTILFY